MADRTVPGTAPGGGREDDPEAAPADRPPAPVVIAVAEDPPGDHVGWLVVSGGEAVAIDPPLDVERVVERLPVGTRVVAAVDLSISRRRISGARPLAEATGADHLVADEPDTLAHLPRLPGIAWRRSAFGVVVDVAGDPPVRIVGEADRSVERHELLAGAPADTRILGSLGERTPDMAPPPGPEPRLNRHAIELTNRGEADLYWADPRFGEPTASLDLAAVRARRGKPWAPTVVDLRAAATPDEGTIVVSPERLASRLTDLLGEPDLVVVGDDAGTAEMAAGFLRRVGLPVSGWLATPRGSDGPERI